MQRKGLAMKKILFMVPPETQPLDLNGPVQVFYEAKELGLPINIEFASISTKNEVIKNCVGLEFANLKSFDHFTLNEGDYLFIPGVSYALLQKEALKYTFQGFFKWLRKQNDKKVIICSICTGAFLLAESGLLNERFCTTHWNRIDDFVKRFPLAKIKKNKLFVKDDNIYTSAGVASGIDLSLNIIELEFGIKAAINTAKHMVLYFRRGESDSQISAFLKYRNHMNDRVHSAQSYLLNNLESPVSIEDIAEHVFMSSRNLSRLFKKTTGITIGTYREQLRIERATQLLSENNTLSAVAKACGLKSVSHLKSLLKKGNSFI